MTIDYNQTPDIRAQQLPTFYINQVQVSAAGVLVRVAVAEGFARQDGNSELMWRLAFTMTIDDALEMAELLINVCSEQKRRIIAVAAAPDGNIAPAGNA